jgi:acyl-CoA thioester hydrolase
VRDSECDLQGVVNNAVYQNYLEHARHKFLIARGLDFAEITKTGVHLVAIRIEIDYLSPLRPGDIAVVSVSTERVSKLRLGFRQSITRVSDGKVCAEAFVVATAIDQRGRPFALPEFACLLADPTSG